MIQQKYIVLLGEQYDGKQIWLAYDSIGRIGNATYNQAFRYDSHKQAVYALALVRRQRRWPNAKVMGTTVEIDDKD
tara:strand:- start:72 stop:299 length:228 start_codon:yes stop_codon:yes gene_type:complete